MSFDINVKVDVSIPDIQLLAAVVGKLMQGHSSDSCGSCKCHTTKPVAPSPQPAEPEAPKAPVAPSPQPAEPEAPKAPVAPAPTYTLEQVARAGAELISADSGKLPQLRELLQKYGVPAVSELKPDQLGGFATELRALGAQI